MDARPMIAVADDSFDHRRCLRELIESMNYACQTFHSAGELLEDLPDEARCILLDLRLPDMGGAQFQQELRQRGATTPVIVMGGAADPTSAVDAIKRGAFDFIEKPVERGRLIELLRRALRYDQRFRLEFAECEQASRRLESLSARERAVMDLVLEGLANKQIAVRLGISQRTVEAHRTRVMWKMNAESLAQLVRIVDRLRYCGLSSRHAGCPLIDAHPIRN